LQIFNSKLVLASPETATDADYAAILGVIIGHECESCYPKTESWENGKNFCLWEGVSCDTKSGHIIGLDLSCNCHQGEFHPNTTLFKQIHLQKLNLAFNNFYNSPMPSGFGDLVALTHLNLYVSAFSGVIPSKISHLSKLVSLDLSIYGMRNEAATLENVIVNVTDIKGITLDFLNMSSIKPSSLSLLVNFSSYLVSVSLPHAGKLANNILCLPNLQKLDLSDNWDLKGELPEFNRNTPLRYLDLSFTDISYNNFGGEISDLFDKLSKLEALYVSENNLVGQLPLSLFGLTQLSYLRCSVNKLVGPMPGKIRGISNLINMDFFESCDLSYNKLQGNIPNSMFHLQNLIVLGLSSNNLSGLVDFHKFLNMQSLGSLDLSHNNFLYLNFNSTEGDYTFCNLHSLYLSSCNINSFPKLLSGLKYLEFLDISRNQIHDRTPKWFNSTWKDTLSFLDLSHNLLTSTMQYIDLSFNMLQGDIPVPPSGIEYFSVSNKKLTGHISSTILQCKLPQCLRTFPYLLVLDLRRNNLSGMIPKTYLEIEALETMNFNENQLDGPLPRSIVKCKQLRVLDLGENNIQDTFPTFLESLQQLQVLVLHANRFNGTNNCLKSKNGFPMLWVFDISNNNFSGNLPTACIEDFKGMMVNVDNGLEYMEGKNYSSRYYDSMVITIKGNIYELERILTTFTTIDLSNNRFEVVIPTIIGELKSLKGLNLSHNRITDLSSNTVMGEIPKALTNLQFLSVLNLSQNKMVGMIPTDSATFKNDEEFWFGLKPLAIWYACGGVFGILLGCIVFFFGKPEWLISFVECI
ncbi:Receptor-like protein 6, partial [Glycine soja]